MIIISYIFTALKFLCALFVLSPPPINSLLLRKVYDMKLYFFIYLFGCTGSCGTQDLHCNMWILYLWHVGSSSLTRDGTQAPCIGSTEF